MATSDPRENHRVFESCWNAGDVDGLLDLYEEGAAYVSSADESLVGHAALREHFEQMTALKIETHLELLHLEVTGDLALERTRWTTKMPVDGGDPLEQSGNSTVVLRRQEDGTWRMVIDDPGLA